MQTWYDVHQTLHKMVWDSQDITCVSYLYLPDISEIRTATGPITFECTVYGKLLSHYYLRVQSSLGVCAIVVQYTWIRLNECAWAAAEAQGHLFVHQES